jgi:RimJ/RimL family protein N-acetyltransferase
MPTPARPAELWPLFDLAVVTPRLTLRYADDERAAALMDLAATVGIHDKAAMPFAVPWTRFEPPVLQQQGMQFYWRTRADTQPSSWELPLAVYEGEQLVGVQAVGGRSFLVTRTVETGSWLARTAQGRGIGKEMRAAVLHLAFAGLDAQRAITSAFVDNPASLGVTRSLGYRENGTRVDDREGKPVEQLLFVLGRSEWERHRRDDIEVIGLSPCLDLLGLSADGALAGD